MRQREVLLVAAVLILAGAPAMALPTPPPGPFLSRGPIVIESDADFTAANGVVAGTGAPGDPFVISGWAIVTSGIAIKVHNVAKEFRIANNSVNAGTGIQITQTASIGVVQNNQVIVKTTGISVSNADAIVVDNSLIGDASVTNAKKGVVLFNSNSRVESNAFVYVGYGIDAQRGSPRILCNDIHDDVVVAGISVHSTTNATIDCNVITACVTAIVSVAAIGTVIVNNTIGTCNAGIDVRITKDVTISNNSIRFSVGTQLYLEATSGNVTGNLILNGQADAVVIVHSPIIFANNTISNHIRVGLRLQTTDANVTANVISRNSVGIAFEGGAIATLTANVMTNNTVGIDLPYGSRQVIVNMSANVVNGINVDGTVNASQRIFFYKEANVNVSGLVIGQANFYGSLTAQGGLVFYEVVNANVNASVIANQNIGVGVVNSFNVNVNSSLILNAQVGIKAQTINVTVQVPPCAVAVKKVNITIPIDPVATIGVDIGNGCIGIIGQVNVSIVDTGIKVGSNAGITLFNSTIFDTKVGLDIQASPNMTNITGNVIANNHVGARFSGTTGLVINNTFRGNAEVGVRLENSARLTFRNNTVSGNGNGLVDAEVCGGALTCSSIDARGNLFVDNEGDGIRMNGEASFRGDVATGNGGDGFELHGRATLDGVIASDNEGDGARILADFEVEDSNFTGNDEDGLEVRGVGTLRDSNFTFNTQAGIRAKTAYVWAIHLNVSHNFDGIVAGEDLPAIGAPTLPTPNLPGLINLVWDNGPDVVLNPFDVHRSTFLANERDAIRAGASVVNATHNYWGRAEGPSVDVADTVGAFSNGVTPGVRFLPYYIDPAMTTTGPVFLL